MRKMAFLVSTISALAVFAPLVFAQEGAGGTTSESRSGGTGTEFMKMRHVSMAGAEVLQFLERHNLNKTRDSSLEDYVTAVIAHRANKRQEELPESCRATAREKAAFVMRSRQRKNLLNEKKQ